MSSNICEQQSDENVVSSFIDSASCIACSEGKAMALTPALIAHVSVSALCFPFGRMQPSTKGVFGIMNRAATSTRAMSSGDGGATSCIGVPCMGVRTMIITAEGEYFEII